MEDWLRWKDQESAVIDPPLLPVILKLRPGLAIGETGARSEEWRGELGEVEWKESVAPPHAPGDTVPDGRGDIGEGVRSVAVNSEDRGTLLSATGVEVAFLGVADLNPRSVTKNKDGYNYH